MYIEELLWLINDSTVVEIYDSNQELIGLYDGKDSIPDEIVESDRRVEDIFVDGNKLCIEISD